MYILKENENLSEVVAFYLFLYLIFIFRQSRRKCVYSKILYIVSAINCVEVLFRYDQQNI